MPSNVMFIFDTASLRLKNDIFEEQASSWAWPLLLLGSSLFLMDEVLRLWKLLCFFDLRKEKVLSSLSLITLSFSLFVQKDTPKLSHTHHTLSFITHFHPSFSYLPHT